ncbi:MAG: hypothetical protein Q8S73_16825 [Deltaproteobacteria bacterium]|nr:hypothetical protein [Myxococcales bacterium]MDP3215773.1 hypothetical protein [Deltaproteobacteria bacterium]
MKKAPLPFPTLDAELRGVPRRTREDSGFGRALSLCVTKISLVPSFEAFLIAPPSAPSLPPPAEEDWSWEGSVRLADTTSVVPVPLGEPSDALVQRALGRYARWLGRGASREMENHLSAAMRWAEERYVPARGGFGVFADRVLTGAEKRFFEMYPRRALAFELRDEHWRARAREGGDALVEYLDYWHRRLAKAQTAFPTRWGVPGMTPDELREELETQLIEAVQQPELFTRYERPGQEATQDYLDARRKRLARRRKFYIADPAAELPKLTDYQPDPEQILHDRTRSDVTVGLVAQLADGPELTRPAKGWLAGFRSYLAERDELNLTEVAESVGKDPSAASRAADAMMEALERMRARALLDLPEAPPLPPGARRRRTGEARRTPDRDPESPRRRRRRRRR